MLDTLITNFGVRPNRTEQNKGKDYHIAYGRWGVGNSNDYKHTAMLENIATNKNFIVANKQWNGKEDSISFLMNESGETNTRIRAEFNYLQIMHNQYIGNVERMGFKVKVHSFSPMVKVRKEESLNEALLWYSAASISSPEVANTIKANKPIGNSEMETMQQHDLYYTDKYVRDMNSLMRYSENVNNIDLLKMELSECLSYAGICVTRPEPINGEFVVRLVQPENFFWDREARKYDLSDAGYMGEFHYMLPTDIYEMNQNLDREELNKIERFTDGINLLASKNGRAKVYKVIWRDLDISEWGYIKNEFEDIVFERVNHTYENEEKPKYTDSDLVPLSELTVYQKNVLSKKKQVKGKSKTMIYTNLWRYCEFIPSEYITTSKKNKEGAYNDLVLSYGILPYQEKNLYSPFNMDTPYKVGMYFYIDGEVYSPIDIAINPQRIANRILSVVENMMNNARGSGSILSQESVDKSNYTEIEVDAMMKENKTLVLPVALHGGAQNAVAKYDASFSNGMKAQLEVAQVFLGAIEKITGVNEAMKGQADNPNQLVGTTQLMIQKGTVVTERYYSALKNTILQIYQSFASVGKRYYINERPTLVSIAGDEGASVIELSKDMANEDFRTALTFTMDSDAERQYVDSTITQYYAGGLIDRSSFADIVGRGSSDDMYMALRRYTKEVIEAENVAAQQQQMQQQQMQQQQQQNVDGAMDIQNKQIEADLTKELIKKEETPMAQQ